MKQLLYYANGGCGNHGCEAIIRSLEHIFQPEVKSQYLTIAKGEDVKYGINELVDLYDIKGVGRRNLDFIKSYIDLKLKKSEYALDLFPYRHILKQIGKEDKLAISIGGDNYCYGGTDYYSELDSLFHKNGIDTVMLGCSIEPDVIRNNKVKTDLASHKLIIARESITYNSLLENGIKNVKLNPDPAFALKTKEVDLPAGFDIGNMVGLNLSPWVERCGNGGNIIFHNAINLIEYIINNTAYKIALIPHVIWNRSNDFTYLSELYNHFKPTGRVLLVSDNNAEYLKGVISKCNMLIAARTHASIAAYSTNVPTVVLGYSVKANGIAKDIFGTADNYVLPTSGIISTTSLIDAFLWLKDNENNIRCHLTRFMPSYIDMVQNIKEEVIKLF